MLRLVCDICGFNCGQDNVPLTETAPVNQGFLIGAFNAKPLLTSDLV